MSLFDVNANMANIRRTGESNTNLNVVQDDAPAIPVDNSAPAIPVDNSAPPIPVDDSAPPIPTDDTPNNVATFSSPNQTRFTIANGVDVEFANGMLSFISGGSTFLCIDSSVINSSTINGTYLDIATSNNSSILIGFKTTQDATSMMNVINGGSRLQATYN